eukprot:Protomagalhaensia_wolfi_Nauph_80__4497@NODE_460_length_2481_cov_69_981572_g346_i0_p3_GENE_NODE_460_length_2481_cov_69_981572_g346_i0NODE_460_length_2481_cov_69_981572_g346_i0_p3_ORF_typecomplete_len123_score7_72C2/PF00168_30/7_3e12_NODE_460_length_2481_cov_69_981572_g346_i0608976
MPRLDVIIDEARNLPAKMGTMDKTDPYIICKVGGVQGQTTAKKNAGSNATYNESMGLEYNWETEMEVIVMDKDKLNRDDHVGTGKLLLTPYIRNHGFQGKVPVFTDRGSPNGEVYLRARMRA